MLRSVFGFFKKQQTTGYSLLPVASFWIVLNTRSSWSLAINQKRQVKWSLLFAICQLVYIQRKIKDGEESRNHILWWVTKGPGVTHKFTHYSGKALTNHASPPIWNKFIFAWRKGDSVIFILHASPLLLSTTHLYLFNYIYNNEKHKEYNADYKPK